MGWGGKENQDYFLNSKITSRCLLASVGCKEMVTELAEIKECI